MLPGWQDGCAPLSRYKLNTARNIGITLILTPEVGAKIRQCPPYSPIPVKGYHSSSGSINWPSSYWHRWSLRCSLLSFAVHVERVQSFKQFQKLGYRLATFGEGLVRF